MLGNTTHPSPRLRQSPSPVSAVPGTTIPVAGVNTPHKTASLQGENVTEQMLQYWSLQANPETQKRFLIWAKKQPIH